MKKSGKRRRSFARQAERNENIFGFYTASSVTGHLSTHAPSTYKIPTAGDIPEHFKVDLWHEPNPEDNVFGSKAVGEPPFMPAISVFEALRDAVAQACHATG